MSQADNAIGNGYPFRGFSDGTDIWPGNVIAYVTGGSAGAWTLQYVTTTNPFPVNATQASTFTDSSGTIAAGGTSQTAIAQNSNRKGWMIQNVSNGNLFWNYTSAATQGSGSYLLAPGAFYSEPNGGILSTEAITIIGASTGQAYTAKAM